MPHFLSQRLSLRRRLKRLTGIALPLAAAAALASSAAQAASLALDDSGSGFSAGGRRPAAGRAVVMHPTAEARELAAAQKTIVAPPVEPLGASTGLFIEGAFGARWGSGQADMTADVIANHRASGTSGDLVLHLIATVAVPAGTFSYHDLASADLGTLDAGTEFSPVDTGEVPFAPPPHGCYYMSLLLLENGNFADIRTLSSCASGCSPTNDAFALFPFGTTCPLATSCNRSVTGACLVGGRFQVAVTYTNDTTGSGAAQVLNFGGTRAESDESVFYFFTDPSNFELGIKILDACSFSSSFWVFLGGLTNQGWGAHILDTQTGHIKNYGSSVGTTTVTVTDTAALPCP